MGRSILLEEQFSTKKSFLLVTTAIASIPLVILGNKVIIFSLYKFL